MTTKNDIAIGKGLGLLVMVKDNSGVEATFRSYLRILVNLDVSKPLNPRFFLSRNDGFSSWVNLKYERMEIYCIDYGKIGHYQASCLALQEEKVPSRHLISLKVNVFSNLVTSIPYSNQPANLASSSSTLKKKSHSAIHGKVTTPCKPDKYPHKFPKFSDTPKTQSLVQNPIAATKPHAQVTPSHISTSTNRLETPIEYTLNALSLFQKPIQLFSSNLSPSPSLTNQTIPLIPN
jgi:hypothetical protein